MDQEAWNEIYIALESDLAALAKRGATVNEMDVVLEIDRARFAMDRGEEDEAILIIQSVRRSLKDADTTAVTRSASPALAGDRLDALEDRLHATTRLGSARLEIVGEDEEDEEVVTRSASKNTKVNKSIKYDDIKAELQKLWDSCEIRSAKSSTVRREADRIVANRKVYEEIGAETDVPWWFVGLIHGMECSFSLAKHLHNGDNLKARTWQVPAGRPKDGSPPFTFVDSAVDALEYDGFSGKTDWPLPMVLYRLERYNGFGYRKKFGFASPYLWSYTNHFTSGKYIRDGVFDANAESKQCGAAAMLRDLIGRGIVSFDAKPAVAVAPEPKPAASTPQPAAASGPTPAPAPTAQPSPAPAPAAGIAATAAAAQPSPAPAPEPAPAPVAAPSPAPAPSPPSAPAVSVEPAATSSSVPAAAPVSEPAKPVEVAPPAAAPPTVAKPEPAPAAPSEAPAPALSSLPASSVPPAGAPSTAAPTTPTEPGSGVTSAVAAALAELAKRSK